MKKMLLCILIAFSFLHAHAQSKYEEMAGKFFRFYNAQSPDSIFALCTPELQVKLPLPKTTAVISGLHIQYGDLKSLKLIKEDNGFNIYKAAFSQQTLSLLLELSSDNLINGYRLVPYDPKQYPEENK